MHVSKNGGDSWDPVQVPTVTPERVTSFHLILNCKIWPGGHINGIGSYLMTSKLTFETFALSYVKTYCSLISFLNADLHKILTKWKLQSVHEYNINFRKMNMPGLSGCRDESSA